MPRHPCVSPPKYRLHRQSGQAVVTLRDRRTGKRRDILLGRFGTSPSRAEYARVVAEWEIVDCFGPPSGANGQTSAKPNHSPPSDLTINELLLAFLRHAESYYVKDGRPTSEQREYRIAMASVRALYGHKLARDFGPLSLKAVRQKMIERDLSRGVINQRIGRIKRIFRWAVAEELVPPSVFQALLAVEGLKRGRTVAREKEPIRPVADDLVDRTLPYLNRQVAAMVRLQRLTGMRPGEVTIMRGVDLDMSCPVWLYRPDRHKNQHLDRERTIAIGPRAQLLVKEFLKPDSTAYLFSPREAREERCQRRRAARKSRVQPSQLSRRKSSPRKTPGECYTSRSYHGAIQTACERAGVDFWHPHQLRHTHATEVRRRHGLEAAQVLLGHSNADVTQVYAERDLRLAIQIAEAEG